MVDRIMSGSRNESKVIEPGIVPIPRRLCIRVVVPTLNEASYLPQTLDSIREQEKPFEIIVVDGGSTDATGSIAAESGVDVITTTPCRGVQLQAGAEWKSAESPDVFLFLHGDTCLPGSALESVRVLLRDEKIVGGKFPVRFDADHPLLRMAGACSRWHHPLFSYGDHGLFVRRRVYEKLGGFDPMPLFEDVAFYRKLKRAGRLGVVPEPLVTSARRFIREGVAKRFARNAYLRMLFALGVPSHKLAGRY